MEIETKHKDDTLILALAGTWSMSRKLPRFAPVIEAERDRGQVRAIAFDTSDLGEWDSSLLTFVLEGLAYCKAKGIEFRKDSLPDNIAALIGLSQVVPEKDTARKGGSGGIIVQLGTYGIAFYDDVVSFLTFCGALASALVGLLSFRVRMRWLDFWNIVQINSSGALPIVSLISFLVGLILAFLGAVVLERFGAGYYVSYIISYGILRELGALMTAIIMAGRTSAAFAAELGSMKISEEISALETLGISPMHFLVLPRFLAIFFMLPFLTVYANFVGIFGGLLVATSLMEVTVTQFMTGLLEPVTLNDAYLGLIKATVYGAIIGIAGCMRGLQTGKDASAVGLATTSAVVTAITLIIFANAVIDWLAVILQF